MPALLLTTVRPFVPRACNALIRFSGMPHKPKPPIMIVAPSGMSATASSALAITLSIATDYSWLTAEDGEDAEACRYGSRRQSSGVLSALGGQVRRPSSVSRASDSL